MSKATYPLKLPSSVKLAAARLAKEDGVSLNQWIVPADAQKIAAVETAAQFLSRRSGGITGDGFLAFLDNVPNIPPVLGDEYDVIAEALRTATNSGMRTLYNRAV